MITDIPNRHYTNDYRPKTNVGDDQAESAGAMIQSK